MKFIMNGNSFAWTGTAGGILTIILANISTADLLKTALLAAVGAIVSCGVSIMLKLFWRKLNK